MRTIRLFISSPGDVERERQRTRRLIERIAHDYTAWATLEPYFWEHEPHDPSADFTTSIGPTSDYDIVVVILWGRLGHRLHSSHRRHDGGVYRSGTEYEVLTALEAQEASPDRLPKLAVFLNETEVTVPLSLEKKRREEIAGQYDALKDFIQTHFQARESDGEGGEILTNKRAYSTYRTLDRFEELLEKQLRLWIETVLGIDPRRGGATGGGGAQWRPEPTWEGNPFQGLAVFEAAHAPIYFGRTRAIGEVVERVRERFGSGSGFLLVFGASGSGKSSLLRAGVLPLVTEPGVVPGVGLWRQAILKPSDGAGDPFAALAAALLRADAALPELADGESGDETAAARAQLDLGQKLRQGPATVAARIEECLRGVARVERERQVAELRHRAEQFEREGRGADVEAALERAASLGLPGTGLLLVVDQMEEMYTGVTKESRRAFLDAVVALAESRQVMVLATLRSDFYAECEDHEALMALKEGAGSYHLQPPTRVEFGQMIREPARAAGLVFEEHAERGRLDERILLAAEADPDALPLLEFCLWKLHSVGHADGVLTHAEYDAIGQLAGVLSQHAEAVFGDLAPHEQGSLEEVIRAVATLGSEDGGGVEGGNEGPAVVRRVVPYEILTSLPGAQGLVDRFIAERLFTGTIDAEGTRVVAVTHEALLRKWDRVSAWLGLDENRRFLEVRAHVAQSLRQWRENGADPSYLLQSGKELDEVEHQYAAYPLAFHEEERDYILMSRARVREAERRRARLRQGVMVALSALTLAALGGGAAALVKQREAVIERDSARHNEGLGWMLRAEVAEERGNRYPDTLLYAAQAIGFDGVGRPAEIGADEEPLRFIRQDRNPADYQAAREWIASRPAYRPLWSSGNRPETPATGLAVDPSGRWLALGSAEGGRLIDLREGGRETVISDGGAVIDLAFSPDGKVLALATEAGAKRWLVEEARLEQLAGVPVSAVAWSPGGDQLAGAGPSGAILLWEKGAGEPETILGAGEGSPSVVSLTYSPDNAFLAGVVPGEGPRVWFPDHRAAASAWVELNAQEETLAKVDERDRPAFLERVGVATTATSVAVSPDGQTLAVGTRETDTSAAGEIAICGGVVLWDAAGATIRGRVSPEQRHGAGQVANAPVTAVAYRADGAQLASGAGDGTIKLWSVSGGGTLRLVATLTGHLGAVTRLVYGPGGTILASAGADGSAKLWEVSGDQPESLDLFAYRGAHWYGFTPEVAWQAGPEPGFLDAGAARLASNWRGPEPAAADAVAALVADAEKAAGEERWRKVELLAQKFERVGGSLPSAVAESLRQATEPRGEQAGDEFTNGEDITLIWCPPTGPGGFKMGSPESEKGRFDDQTLHTVILTSGFWLGQTEVTQAQWVAVMGRNPATYKDDLSKPVEMVNWDEAMEYCRRLTDRERARGTLPAGWVYTLPTEAQWVYACRAGTSTAWSFGDEASRFAPLDRSQPKYGNFNDRTGNWNIDADANQDDGEKYTAPVQSYRPNTWGLYDMHGNVWEWCRDWYQADHYAEGQVDPEGPVSAPPSGAGRVFRGGSWVSPAAYCRSADRNRIQPGNRDSDLGFRVAAVQSLSHPEEKKASEARE